jgi:signal peptidase
MRSNTATPPAAPPLPPPATPPLPPPDTATYPSTRPARSQTGLSHQGRGRVGVVRLLSSILLAAVLVLILTVVVGMVLGMWRFAVIDTGSMRPTLNPGDVAVLTSERPAAIKRGQIVAFHPPGKPRLTVIHRVFSLHRTRDGVIIRTKGDANNALDPWRARIIGDTVWHDDLKLPKVGYLTVWSQQRPVRLGLLIVIVALVVSLLLAAIWRPSP